MTDPVRWWDLRAAQSMQPKTYVCPLCHAPLPAMTPNTLLFPEGDHARRRHAHNACVAEQRRAGRLLTRSEWERANRAPRARESWWRRWFGSRRDA